MAGSFFFEATQKGKSMEELITVARLLKPHGVRGDIKAEPLTHDPSRLAKLKRVFLTQQNGQPQEHTLIAASAHGDLWHLRFAGFESPEAAIALNNSLVQIPITERIAPPEGLYYSSELEGLNVIDDQGKVVGKVLSVLDLPSVTSLEVKIGSHTILAPWIPACVGEIDLAKRTVLIHLSFLGELME